MQKSRVKQKDDFLHKAQLLGFSLKPLSAETELRYKEYIRSPLWRARKELYYERYKKECAVCFSTATTVDLNHAFYGDLGQERDEDLIPFCREHHEAFHKRFGVSFNMREQCQIFIQYERQRLLNLDGKHQDGIFKTFLRSLGWSD